MKQWRIIPAALIALSLAAVPAIAQLSQEAVQQAVTAAVAAGDPFPVGTEVKSITVSGTAITVDLSAAAAGADFGDSQSDAIVKALNDAVGDLDYTALEVTVEGKNISEYLPASSGAGSGAQSLSMGARSVPVIPNLTSELAGKKIALHPSHGSYWHQGYGYWFRAMRTFCGPNPEPPRPAGWQGSTYQPSNYYYYTRGFQWLSMYEDDYSPETIRFLKAYLESSGASVFVSRELDKNAGDFPYAAFGYPNCSFPLPRWQTAAKYYLQEQGLPASVWNEPTLTAESDKDIRARPYYANYVGADVSLHLHSNAAGSGNARGTETYWYTAKYPWLQADAIRFAGTMNNGVVNAINSYYGDAWGKEMYKKGTSNPPEWPSGTYPGYTTWANRGVKTSNFGEIREAMMPAVLCELAFHDDWKFFPDHVFLMDQIFRATCAWGFYEGVCNYFGVTPKPRMAAEKVEASFPAFVKPGDPISGSIKMKNLGMSWCWGNKWVEGLLYIPYTVWKLAPTANDQLGGAQIAIDQDAIIHPGQEATFTINLTAPATSGYYNTEWRMLKDDEKGGAFGEVVTAQIGVDGDAPAIAIAAPAAASFRHTDKITLDFSATDAMSGVASVSATLDGVAVADGDVIELMSLSLGAHTLVVTSADNLGNSATSQVVFNVYADLDSQLAAVTEFWATGEIDNEGIYASLLAKLAADAKRAADVQTAKNIQQSFINEVEAQSGKHITTDAATWLLNDAHDIQDKLGTP